ncbi:hypothetical protein HK098_001797 [Nowakowskiella sp. JEL0407]|nr:hypothetical protein HK098_001797 [Nowakowskiella sp. JEL0407]
MQARSKHDHAASTYSERSQLLQNCISACISSSPPAPPNTNVKEYNQSLLQDFIRRWFIYKNKGPGECVNNVMEIGVLNLEIFFSWVFFDKSIEEMTLSEIGELKALVTLFCEAAGLNGDKLMNWLNPDVTCVRLTLDETKTAHRPLVYYLVTHTVHLISHIYLLSLGFTRRKINTNKSAPAQYVYQRIPTASNRLQNQMPIIFIHGLGIGLATYLNFIKTLPVTTPMYLVDWPHVSMSLVEEAVPEINDVVEMFKMLLFDSETGEYSPACFAGHSLGTAAVSWVVHAANNNEIPKEVIGSVVLIDPVSILLSDSKVAINFLYKRPEGVLEVLMEYFVAREKSIAKTLSRHFQWSKNNVFYEDFERVGLDMKKSVKVIVGEKDHIAPVPQVVEYFAKRGDEVVIMEGFSHGQILFDRTDVMGKYVSMLCSV